MMAEENNINDAESVMDYGEHERTYGLFLTGSKLLVLLCVTLLIAMAFGFFAGGGLIGGTLAFIILTVIGYYFV